MNGPRLIDGNSFTVDLADGRTLGFVEYGARDGRPLLYFHGLPGSRLEARALDEAGRQLGARVIGIDRPGMGRSSFQRGRRLRDWPDDVAELADRLRIERFGLAGCSGGGPYALACALRIPARIGACGIISGAGIVGPFLSRLARFLPTLAMPLASICARSERSAAAALGVVAGRWPAADRAVLQREEVCAGFAASLCESFRQGARGPAHDARLLGGAWGFALEDVRHPLLHWWHGERDTVVPVRLARAGIARLNGCGATFYPEDGHVSVIVDRAPAILGTLLEWPR